MSINNIFDELIPQNKPSLPALQGDENISELYNRWYDLQIRKVDLEKSLNISSKVSFKVMETAINNFTEITTIEPTSNSLKIVEDSKAKFAEYKKEYRHNNANEILGINSQIANIKDRIESYAKSFLYTKDFKLELRLSLFKDLTAGKLEIHNMNPDLRIPLFYLFNNTVPQLNLTNTPQDIYANLVSRFPEDLESRFISTLTQKERLRESENVKELMVKHISQYFQTDMRGYLNIPLHISQEKGDFGNGLANIPLDTKITTSSLILLRSNKGLVRYDENTINAEYHNDKHFQELHKSLFFNYGYNNMNLDLEIRFEIERTITESLTKAAGIIIANFAKNKLADKIQYKEISIPINNPNI